MPCQPTCPAPGMPRDVCGPCCARRATGPAQLSQPIWPALAHIAHHQSQIPSSNPNKHHDCLPCRAPALQFLPSASKKLSQGILSTPSSSSHPHVTQGYGCRCVPILCQPTQQHAMPTPKTSTQWQHGIAAKHRLSIFLSILVKFNFGPHQRIGQRIRTPI